jgi:uncharacterized GH25 family protein
MKRILIALTAVVLLSSHDMYLKLDSFFLQPNTSANIQLYNGTFDKSENAIARDRMADVSLVGNGNRTLVDSTQWSEQDNATILSFTAGDAGTWMAGVSTHSRDFAMDAKAFNLYLEHDGIADMVDWRNENSAMDQDAVERYAKHVKTIFQVGETRTDDWQSPLGYPIEFVPLSNPYDLHAGDVLKVKLLWQGKPLANQLVYVDSDQSGHAHNGEAGHEHEANGEEHGHEHGAETEHEAKHEHEAADKEHSHDHNAEAGHEHEAEEAHHHDSALQYRTNEQGVMGLRVAADGIWNLRTIYLVNSDESDITHESNWATLTFGVDHSQGHSHAEAVHEHDEHEAGIPAYAYWGGSLLLLVGLFLWFNRKA